MKKCGRFKRFFLAFKMPLFGILNGQDYISMVWYFGGKRVSVEEWHGCHSKNDEGKFPTQTLKPSPLKPRADALTIQLCWLPRVFFIVFWSGKSQNRGKLSILFVQYREDTEPLYHAFMYSLASLLSDIYPLPTMQVVSISAFSSVLCRFLHSDYMWRNIPDLDTLKE